MPVIVTPLSSDMWHPHQVATDGHAHLLVCEQFLYENIYGVMRAARKFLLWPLLQYKRHVYHLAVTENPQCQRVTH